MPARYNDETINVAQLIQVLDILPEDSTIFINKLYQLAWLPVDDDNPGGVIEFERQCVNPHGVLVQHYDFGSVIIHGPDDIKEDSVAGSDVGVVELSG